MNAGRSKQRPYENQGSVLRDERRITGRDVRYDCAFDS